MKSKRRQLRGRQTPHEAALWRYLRNRQVHGYRFLRQYSIGNYILDFYCPTKRIAIELDGKQHADPENTLYDQQRSQWLNQHNILVLRFWNGSVEENLDGIIQEIKDALEGPAS